MRGGNVSNNSPRGFKKGEKSFTEEELVGRRLGGGSPLIVHLFERRKVFRGAKQQVFYGEELRKSFPVCVCVCVRGALLARLNSVQGSFP